MNFLRQDFRKLSCARQTDTTKIIYHAAASWVSLTVKSSQMDGQMDQKWTN